MHTPGPWIVEGTLVYALWHEGDYDKGQPRMVNRFWAQIGSSPRLEKRGSEEDANARLIAAAPDMLAALEKAYAFLNLASQDTMAAKIGRDVATVIAAATGKQP